MELWIGCVAGALSEQDYLAKLAGAGFEAASIEVTRVYGAEEASEFLAGQHADLQQLAQQIDGKFVSGFIRAVKPAAREAAEAAGAAPAGPAPRAAEAACSAPGCCASKA